MSKRIYLDNNATTPLAKEVLETVCDVLKNCYGNPSSMHKEGREARKLLQKARAFVADYFNVSEKNTIFTSSGTEAINLVLRGMGDFLRGKHVVTSMAEHPAVYNTLKILESEGVRVTWLKPRSFGAPSLQQVQEAIKADTALIALMAVNNETGVITDIERIASYAAKKNIYFFVDAVQLLGKDVCRMYPGVSAMVFSGHKIHGPKGVGALVIREDLPLVTQITGGGQEEARRSGTENVPAICGFSRAIECIGDLSYTKEILMLRERFEEAILSKLANASINGTGPRVCNTVNILFKDVSGEELLAYLDMHGVAASFGSACTSGALEASKVLLGMELSQREALSSIRFSLSRYTTIEEIDQAAACVIEAVQAFS